MSRALRSLCVLVPLIATGCNDHAPYEDGPDLFGVTVPLPPPSFALETDLHFDLAGVLPSDHEDGSVKISMWVSGPPETTRGYFVDNRGSNFEFIDIEIDLRDNCMATWYEDEFDPTQEPSPTSYFSLVLVSDPARCTPENRCSAPDSTGACVCVTDGGSC